MSDGFVTSFDTLNAKDVVFCETVKPSYNITFHGKAGEEIGRLDCNGDQMKFTGKADEAAKVFFDFVANSFAQRLKEERTKGRLEACSNY